MEVRITYRSEVYIEGNSLDEIKQRWEDSDLTSNITQNDNRCNFVELISVEDADTFEDLTSKFE